MDRISLRSPTPDDLLKAALAARSVHVALPAVMSFAGVALLTNPLTAIVSVGITTYLQLLFRELHRDSPPEPPREVK